MKELLGNSIGRDPGNNEVEEIRECEEEGQAGTKNVDGEWEREHDSGRNTSRRWTIEDEAERGAKETEPSSLWMETSQRSDEEKV
jgi:hypothetical protein